MRDELADDLRLVIEPVREGSTRSAHGIAVQAHRAESRIPLNMNVLVKGRIPRVLGLAEALRGWLSPPP